MVFENSFQICFMFSHFCQGISTSFSIRVISDGKSNSFHFFFPLFKDTVLNSDTGLYQLVLNRCLFGHNCSPILEFFCAFIAIIRVNGCFTGSTELGLLMV